ncbi:MAG: UDP-N-acetylmuramoyl-L-alanyl-D-glutamate--2,6-diaminopimelate ligase [Clostridiales bacterium]|nr:UDP-N-acetylmuramoyl-L-alanyl-D-glutamate--2,6-diaminopimelate ligase [Clostridiales bacterium]
MKLGTLIESLPIELVCGNLDEDVAEIVFDSRKAGSNALFVALPSSSARGIEGHMFIEDAWGRGCRSFLVSSVPEGLAGREGANVLHTKNTRHGLALISQRFFGEPDKRLKMIGLTGTNGKTTISYMLKYILEKAGKKVGLIGSNGIIYPGFYEKLLNTTPESSLLYGYLNGMADDGVEYCILEATSQGFMHNRTDGIVFDAALFTNITPDHISQTEHTDFEHYLECKKLIFKQSNVCFVNRDAGKFDDIVAGVPSKIIRLYGLSHEDGGKRASGEGELAYTASDIRFNRHGNRMAIDFACKAPDWKRELRVNIPGLYNVENALGAICIADHFGIDADDIAAGLDEAQCAGRMEYVDTPAPYTIIIDFAHNEDGVRTMMEAAKAYNPKRILCVYGLQGDRAHIRRSGCGKILGETADYMILSDACPKTDDPDQVLDDLAAGVEAGGGAGRYEIIRDRNISIPKILDMAEEGDIVLLSGRGNTLYEEVFDELIPLDEREVVRKYFEDKAAAKGNTTGAGK